MKNESQYGLLLLQRYLYEHTDDQHPASVADILAFWQEHGIQAGRKSVYSAIEVLQSSGMDIICVKSTQNRYFVGERLFELPELILKEQILEAQQAEISLEEQAARRQQMWDSLIECSEGYKECDDEFVRQIIQKITVEDADTIRIQFRDSDVVLEQGLQ